MNTVDRRVPVLVSDHTVTLHDPCVGIPPNLSRIQVIIIFTLKIETSDVRLNVAHDMKSSYISMNTVNRRV